MPLYVIRAQSLVKPKANQVVLTRKGAEMEVFALADEKYEKVLILPGDIIEFKDSNAAVSSSNQFYYISDIVRESGRKDHYKGITLTQAILASGGLAKSKVNKIVIRRRNSKGLLESKTYNLKNIKKGKTPDPVLEVGDIIERGKGRGFLLR